MGCRGLLPTSQGADDGGFSCCIKVLPYLGRRAIENKALLSGEGGASAERRRVWAEICRRIGF